MLSIIFLHNFKQIVMVLFIFIAAKDIAYLYTCIGDLYNKSKKAMVIIILLLLVTITLKVSFRQWKRKNSKFEIQSRKIIDISK